MTITSGTLVKAIFNLKTFTIPAGAGANGSIFPSGRISVHYGGSQKFAFKPNQGYKMGAIKVDGVSVGKPDMLVLGKVTGSHTIEAIFSPRHNTGE
jgi:hypothetical protein